MNDFRSKPAGKTPEVWNYNKKQLGGNGMISRCENCKLRKNADKNPDSLIARFWRWHTRWCPGWKAYQKKLSR